MNIKSFLQNFILALFLSCASSISFAGGLDKATDTLTEIKVWAFSFVGVCALCYLIYNIIMAFMERKSWSDAGMALVYCSFAGGALFAGNWALDLFK
ncbi:conjugal transfer protein [Escherichia coli]|uniref:conjugal transfer protein n=1 Tax=Escherichia coli TaxID=562 RepID=UPI00137226C7|nr:conjugal transfer protein [Escherichia coli]ELH6552590.1 conjugal transfer protein [Escherichia coli]ELH6567266.1 conjugal transfer protein [Escherichia coli]ELH6581082.1 conjugal transfer protein [Escherichia coli]ELH6599256.1 conjugal transfer protein [Escherichia coli]ELH6613843.1 conjugal transfer protein [Escherichia coli]